MEIMFGITLSFLMPTIISTVWFKPVHHLLVLSALFIIESPFKGHERF